MYLKQKLRVIFKSMVIKILMFLYKLFNLFKKKKEFNLENINKVIILHKKPLGLGDMVMLSPLYLLIIKHIKKDIYIVSDYDKFLDFETAIWKKPSEVDNSFFKNSLVISPTLTLPHLKYMLHAKYYIGYFISNKLLCNFSNIIYSYDAVNEHYLEKVFIILDILNIQYDNNNFEYAKVITKEVELPNNYIVIAPYANWEEKQYSVANYLLLIDKLLVLSNNYNIVLIGSSNLQELIFNNLIYNSISSDRLFNYTGKTSIIETNFIIQNSKITICNDSGPANISYITSPKTLVFFGAVNVQSILPKNDILKNNISVFTNNAECTKYPCYDGYNKPHCYNKEKFSCLNVSVSEKDLIKILEND